MTETKTAQKKVARKKAAPRKAAPRKVQKKSTFEMLEDSMVGQPFVIANKVFLASLGLFSTIQTEVGNKFDGLVKDGEKARDDYQASIEDFREKVSAQLTDATNRLRDFVKPAQSQR